MKRRCGGEKKHDFIWGHSESVEHERSMDNHGKSRFEALHGGILIANKGVL